MDDKEEDLRVPQYMLKSDTVATRKPDTCFQVDFINLEFVTKLTLSFFSCTTAVTLLRLQQTFPPAPARRLLTVQHNLTSVFSTERLA